MRIWILACCAFVLSAAPALQAPAVEALRCEYLTDPLGIDVSAPRLSWVLNAPERGQKQTAYRILVASNPALLGRDRGDLWDSGKVAAEQGVFVPYGGKALSSGQRCWWKVRVWDANGRPTPWSAEARWSMGLLQTGDWKAQWIGLERAAGQAPGPLAFPWLRKTFNLERKPLQGTAYVNALGYYELYINGRKVDDHVLAPAVSDYSKRNLYVTHDISNYLVAGTNCVALWLGRGWYVKGHPGVVHDGPLVRMQMELDSPGPGARTVVTDASWRVKASPITPLGRGTAFGDYGGERFDAALDQENWNAIGLDDSGWQSAAVFQPPEVLTAAQMVQPNRIMNQLAAAKVEEVSPGVFQVDMGRNYTGWFELRLPASLEAGKLIRIEYADSLRPGNRFATANQRDEYVTRAGAGQMMRSRFNYHAFRYARVTGLDRAPAPADARGYQIHTSYEPAGSFESSNEFLNTLYRTVTWTYRNLSLGGYVVDCPHRERLGYGGDAGTSMETGMFNFDAGGLYNRWTANWRDAQNERGDVPYTAPAYPDQGGGGPMWSGFLIMLPWQLYLQYGDQRILEVSYPHVQKLLEFWEAKSRDGILEPYVSYGIRMPQWNYLGDWVTPKRAGDSGGPRDPVSGRFINNCYYLYTLQHAAKIAGLLGRQQDAARYAARADGLAKLLHERYYRPAESSYATGEQPYLAFPLWLGLTPPDLRAAVMQNLENTIRVKNQGHIDAGMHGVYFLLRHLMQQDRNDLIYEMATKKTYPSWGYMLEQGATTIWEGWQGGSHIHDTLISIGAWFTEGIGGIRFDERAPGFRHVILQPGVVGDLTFARSSYRSIRGTIVSNWRREGATLRLDVTIPAGSTATVLLPAAAAEAVTESGAPAARARNVRALGMRNGRAAFGIGSGSYSFASRMQ